MKQMLLFPDPRPLAERLGRDFFRSAPEGAGVYLMRDAADDVLYVGKAKNLRKRLGSYRVANPDRMPRRHLRMLRAVVRIEWRECPDEASALAREAELLLALRPKFNRAGTWPVPARYLGWRCIGEKLELAVIEKAEDDWRAHGPVGGAVYLRAALARLLWLATHPESSAAEMPVGRFRSGAKLRHAVHCGALLETAAARLERLLLGEVEHFTGWVRSQTAAVRDAFTAAALAEDLELIANALALPSPRVPTAPQNLPEAWKSR